MIKARGGVGAHICDIEVPDDVFAMSPGEKVKVTIEAWWIVDYWQRRASVGCGRRVHVSAADG